MTAAAIVHLPKICAKCGSSERHANGRCAPCRRESRNKSYQNNKEKAAADGAAYRAANREKLLADKKKWALENKESISEKRKKALAENGDELRRQRREKYAEKKVEKNKKQKEYYEKNKEKILLGQSEYYKRNRVASNLYSKAWAEKNKEKRRAIGRAWASRNRDSAKENTAKRRAVIKSSGVLSKGIVKRLYEIQKGLCVCCKNKLGEKYHLDHIIPLAKGGTNTDNNVQLLTSECNLKKGAKHPVDYMQQMGFLI